jgi:hypothetical protein
MPKVCSKSLGNKRPPVADFMMELNERRTYM